MLYDKDIREPLFRYFEAQYDKIRIIEEKNLAWCRADAVAVLPDKLIGIEIKSDADGFSRLPRQVRGYDRCCDLNYVVVGSTHAKRIPDRVPEWWGVISVKLLETGIDFQTVREPQSNPNVELEAQLTLLWRSELAHIQKRLGMPKYTGKSREFVRKKLLEKCPESHLHQQICEELFERDYTI